MTFNSDLKAPKPVKNRLLAALASPESARIPRSSSTILTGSIRDNLPSITSKTPDPRSIAYDSNEKLLKDRLERYNLDYPQDYNIYLQASLNEHSKWFSRKTKRKLNLTRLLPYNTETHIDHAKYLSHILVHLYIAIKSMDLEGSIAISTKDLSSIKDNVELALDTDFFNADLSHDFETFQADGEYDLEGDDEDNEVRSSGIIGKIMPRSATVISLNHWTNELKSFLKMKVDLPLTLRASLAKVYYHLSLSTGQKIENNLFISMFIKLIKKYQDLLKDILVLDHKPLLTYLSQFLQDPNPSYSLYHPTQNEADKKFLQLYTKLALSANSFFSDDSMREIFDWCLGKYSLSSPNLVSTLLMCCLPVKFNSKESVLDYLPVFFQLLSTSTNKTLELNIFELLGRISYFTYKNISKKLLDASILKDYGIFTESQFDFMLNKLQNNLKIEHRINSFGGIGLILSYSLTSKNYTLIFKKINSLLSTLETFIHPSNVGSWTSLISKFIHRFCVRYTYRYKMEQDDEFKDLDPIVKLNTDTNSMVFRSFKDLILLGCQSKKESVSNTFIMIISSFADMPCDYTHELFNQILLDAYDSLTDQYINSSHRLNVSLRQLCEVTRFLVQDEVYRIHITNILSLLLNKIGTIDLSLTTTIFNNLATIFSFIKIYDLSTSDDFISFESTTSNLIQDHLYFIKQNPTLKFQPDKIELKNAFIASTKIFKDLMKTLLDKYILLIEADLTEKALFRYTQTFMILMESLSDDIFDYLSKIVKDKLVNEQLCPNFDSEYLSANIVGIIVKKNPKLSSEFFYILDDLVRNEIKNGAGKTVSNTSEVLGGDKKLRLYLTVLSEILSVSGGEILTYRNDYLSLISYLYDEIKTASLFTINSYIIHKTLKNLTNIKLKENKVLQNDNFKWGLNDENEDDKFKEENLNFDWYIPSSKEMSFAIEIFESITIKCVTKIDAIIAEDQINNINRRDDLIKCLSCLTYSLTGSSILFDPEFSSEGIDEDESNSLQKKLMILKSLRESRSEDHEMNVDLIEPQTKNESKIKSDDLETSSTEINEGAVKIGAENSNPAESMDIDMDDKSLTSRAVTPSQFDDSSSESVMNPTIAFRELKLYNCNYFFGQTLAEKRRNFNYGHVHSLKTLIGHCLHRLAVSLSSADDSNVRLIQALLISFRTYFCDVGKESTFDVEDQLFLDYNFIRRIQHCSSRSKSFTRAALGARIEKFHRQRIILHSTNRFLSKLDKILIKDLLIFATSSVSTISMAADGFLVESMEKLIGSYGLILSETLQHLENFIEKGEFNRVIPSIRILNLKSIFKKISHDYSNIQRIMEVLGPCLTVDDLEASSSAQLLMTELSMAVKVPSNVAIFNELEIDKAIRPNDKHIDLEISTVKAAKDKKRKQYYSKLNGFLDFLIEEEAKVTHWKLSLRYLRYAVNLQECIEIPLRKSLVKVLIERLKSNHPTLMRFCIKSYVRLFSIVYKYATYDHDLRNWFDLDYKRSELLEIDSSSENFDKEFIKESQNYQNPKYYIDSFMNDGFLFWGKTLTALKPSGADFNLNEEDLNILRSTKELITKDFLKQLFKVLAEENETNGNFQESEVSLITHVVLLIKFDAVAIKYDELLELIAEVHDKDDKASVINVAEIVTGLLEGTQYTSKEDIIKRDEFLTNFFKSALSTELTSDSAAVWTVVFWIIPSNIDFRRIPVLIKEVEGVKQIANNKSIPALVRKSRIGFSCSFLAYCNYKYTSYSDFLRYIPLNDPYQTIRNKAGHFVSVLAASFMRYGYQNSDKYLESIKGTEFGSPRKEYPEDYSNLLINLFNKIKEENSKIGNLSVEELLSSEYYYLSSTMFSTIGDILSSVFSSLLAPLIKDYIAPFLIEFENNRELCKLAKIEPIGIYLKLSKINLVNDQLPDIITTFTTHYPKVHQILMQLSFSVNFFTKNLFLLTDEQKETILEFADHYLFHTSIEVRGLAGKIISVIFHNSFDLTEKYLLKYQKTIKKNKKIKDLSNEKVIKLHGCTLGIGALVSAFPYVSPPPSWLVENISLLAKASSISGIVGKSAKDMLSQFKKVRADTWHIDRESFTEEQLEDLEGVLWRSYFA